MFNNGTISYPFGISFIQLCDGSYTYVLTDLVSDIYGGYNILDEIVIENEDELIDVQIREEEARFAMQFTHEPNGNIEQMKWKISNRATSVYDLTYDPIDRVVNADFSEEYYLEEIQNQGTNNEYISRRFIREQNERYSTGYTYDGGGNILTIWRNGLGTACLGPEGRIDDMTLTYGGEGGQQLLTVTDAAATNLRPFGFKPHDSAGHGSLEYTYDENGNMTYDPHKELDVIYNYLNLPLEAEGPNSSLKTVYDATGRKWKKENTIEVDGTDQTTTILYADGMEFEETADYPLRLASINGHEDGRSVQVYDQAVGGDIATRAEYYHKDHLGNVRLSFSDLNQDGALTVRSIYDPTNEILLEKSYYPFGLELTGPWFATVMPDNKYRYNGKELDEATGLYEYGFRYYDPSIGRFTGVDPIADQFAWVSMYNYAENEPIRHIDLHGLQKFDPQSGQFGPFKPSLNPMSEILIDFNANKSPKREHTALTDDNRENLSGPSIGETLGVYPTENTENPSWSEVSNPESWNEAKTEELLEARASIDYISENRNDKTGNASLSGASDEVGAYHLKDNFPNVPSEIKDDSSVTHFYLSNDKNATHTGVSGQYWDQKAVKTYGPFHNVGGGDVPKGPVYIIFYSVTPKTKD